MSCVYSFISYGRNFVVKEKYDCSERTIFVVIDTAVVSQSNIAKIPEYIFPICFLKWWGVADVSTMCEICKKVTFAASFV